MRPDLTSLIFRRGARAAEQPRRCSTCRRTPLPGELLHELADDSVVCQLCLQRRPEAERETRRSERILATDRPLTVVPRAA